MGCPQARGATYAQAMPKLSSPLPDLGKKTNAKVGPFLYDSGSPNPSPDFAAEALRKQYNSVFATRFQKCLGS